MPQPEIYNTELTKNQIAEAFRRALGDMTDSQIDEKINAVKNTVDTITPRLLALESNYTSLAQRVTALEDKGE